MINNPSDRRHSMQKAIASLDSGCCVWCAQAPAAATSYLCGTCRTQVLSGDVQCASQMLDEQDRQDGFVLACVTKIESDCTIDA